MLLLEHSQAEGNQKIIDFPFLQNENTFCILMSTLPSWLDAQQVYPDVVAQGSAFIDNTIEKLSSILARFHASSEAALGSGSASPCSPASPGAEKPWEGLDSEGRSQFTALARELAASISGDLAAARAFLGTLLVADVKAGEYREGLARGQGELARLGAVIGALPPVPGGGAPYSGAAAAAAAAAASLPPLPTPLTPRSAASAALAATPLAAAQLALEAYRECLVRTLDLLEAAAEGRSSLPTSNVLGALEATCGAVYTAEGRLKEALQACSDRCRDAAASVGPLARALAAARAEARARAASLNARVHSLEAALGSAKQALSTIQAAGQRPVHLRTVLGYARTLAPPPAAGAGGGAGGAAAAAAAAAAPTGAQVAATLTARLQALHSGRGEEEGSVVLGGERVLLRELSVARQEGGGSGGGGGLGPGEGLGAAASDLAPKLCSGGGMDVEEEPAQSAAAAAAAPSIPAPAPQLNLATAIRALTAAQRAQLLALLPPGWRPGQPLPPHIPDVATLLQQVTGPA